MSRSPLTGTSHAVLGLLAERPLSAYELAATTAARLGDVWPRGERALYTAPKALAAAGLVTARTETTGRRRRTVYAITPKGRRELARWLERPSAPPTLRAEALLRTLLADHTSKDRTIATIAELRVHAAGLRARLLDEARASLDDETVPGGRLHLDALASRFVLEHAAAIERWASWAEGEVADWPSTGRDAQAHGARIVRDTIERFAT